MRRARPRMSRSFKAAAAVGLLTRMGTAHGEAIQGRRSRCITYQDGMRIESALAAQEASE